MRTSKLTDETRTNLATAAHMVFTKLQELPYMNACFDEALRILRVVGAHLDAPDAFDVRDPAGHLQHIKACNTWNKPALQCRLKDVKW